MKAITLHQPHASFVALGLKNIETRSWNTHYRGPLAIHAAATVPSWVLPLSFAGHTIDKDNPRPTAPAYLLRGPSLAWPYRLPLGAVVATCTLVDVVPMVGADGCKNATTHLCIVNQSMLLHSPIDEPWPDGETEHIVSDQLPYGDFTPGRFAWLLADITPLDPPVPSPPGEWHRGLWTWEPVVA